MHAMTIYDRIWERHLVWDDGRQTPLIYVDRHLLNDVTSPQAFEGLRLSQRYVRRPDLACASVDHNVPTKSRDPRTVGALSRRQMDALKMNAAAFGIRLLDMDHPDNGIGHVIGPELGFTLPGMTIVCGDSHTSTHGAFGSLAFGIGTSEVEHVLATQTLPQRKSKNMLIRVDGKPSTGVTAKDIILHIIGQIGTNGGQGYVIEYAGEAIRGLSMEGRMTVCNMTIEAGARAGIIAPDQTTFDYIRGRTLAPQGEAFARAVQEWQTLPSDEDAHYDRVLEFDASTIAPQVTWGTSPEQVSPVEGTIPLAMDVIDSVKRESYERALEYMGLQGGKKITEIEIDTVFIGSCTNSRMEDLRAAASVIKGRRVKEGVRALVVPGSGQIRRQAEEEGLDRIFLGAGFEWRHPGCSLCLAMNDDSLEPGERCASTSNRNFEGRQGRGGRTHLVSPGMAAAAAIAGRFVDVRNF